MPVFEDWLNDPLTIVNNIFGKHHFLRIIRNEFRNLNNNIFLASDPVNFDQKVNEYFEDKLKSEKIYYSVNPHNFFKKIVY